MALSLVPLHTRQDLIKPCISLLYEEWPDGKHNRLEVLETRCPNPPCTLALLLNQEDKDTVIGHCRIVPVKNYRDAVFIEQVVIEKLRRRRRFGTRLLEMTEKYCAEQGFKTLFLQSSPAMPQFYLRVGYNFTECRPHVVGSMMLDHTIQVPLSSPYPGWECYYTPYDGRVCASKKQDIITCAVHELGLRSVDNEKAFDSHEQGCTEDVDVPSWSMDVDGYCHMKKDI